MRNKIITIVGVGLLGGSYAQGLTNAGNTVYGIDTNEESIDFAIKNSYIEHGKTSDYGEFLAASDVVVLCLYPTTLIEWTKNNAHLINKNAVVTDVCGVKAGVVSEIQDILEPYGIEFYASHPMRGKETLGVENADCSIFENANLILVPSKRNTKSAENVVRDLAATLGFTTISELSPLEHDRMVGYLSQLTHAIAVSLMTANDGIDLIKYSGDSFKDLTRIAKIDEHLWSELFSWNKDILCDEIDVFVDNLLKLKSHIKKDEIDEMKEMFKLSTKRRQRFDDKKLI